MLQTPGHPHKIKKKKSNSNEPKSTDDTGGLNTQLSTIDRSSRQKINQETLELLHTLDEIYMVAVYRVFHSTTR
jgi:hypothetical protein